MSFRQATVADLDSIEEGYAEHFAHEKKYGAYTVFQEGVYPARKVAETAYRREWYYAVQHDNLFKCSSLCKVWCLDDTCAEMIES